MPCPNLVEEFKRNPELKEEDLQHLRDWNKKEAHLPIIPDNLLVKFLHKSRFSLEKTKRVIEACFTVRTLVPECYTRLDHSLPQVQHVWKYVQSGYLTKTDSDGCQVIVYKLYNADPSLFIYEDFITWWDLSVDVLFDDLTMPGLRVVIDMKDLSLGHIMRLNFTLMPKIMYYIQNGLCVRLKSVHFISLGPMLDKLMSLLKPILKNKLVKKMHFHSSLEDLYKMIPQDLLPPEYGGKGHSMEVLTENLKKKMVSKRDFCLEFQNLVVDERRRQNPASNATNGLFGVDGSFRKLNLD